MERKKSDEEAKKMQRRELTQKVILEWPEAAFEIPWAWSSGV
jgi:hypothetical protein